MLIMEKWAVGSLAARSSLVKVATRSRGGLDYFCGFVKLLTLLLRHASLGPETRDRILRRVGLLMKPLGSAEVLIISVLALGLVGHRCIVVMGEKIVESSQRGDDTRNVATFARSRSDLAR